MNCLTYFFDKFFHKIFFFWLIFWRIIFWQIIFWQTVWLIFVDDFLGGFYWPIYCLLTIASFRIGVPLILFLHELMKYFLFKDFFSEKVLLQISHWCNAFVSSGFFFKFLQIVSSFMPTISLLTIDKCILHIVILSICNEHCLFTCCLSLFWNVNGY